MAEGTTTGERAPDAPPPTPRRIGAAAALAWNRLPFTTTVLLAMLALGIATGTLWSPLSQRSWYPDVAYGLPSLLAGRVWTPLTGALFALEPPYYVPVILSFGLFVGFAEYRLGTLRTVLITIGGQLVAVLGSALLLLAFRDSGWDWARRLATELDAGFSAGALAAAAVASATLHSPWRLRVRLALCVYVLVSFLYVGTLADLEHLVAVAVALPLGGRLAGDRRAEHAGRPSRREWRLLAVAFLVGVAVATVLLWLVPSDGPLGSTAAADESWLDVVITLLVVALLVNGLRRGKRVAWWCAVVLSGLNVFVGLTVGVLVAVAIIGDLPYEVEGAPLFVADRLIWAGLLAVLLVGHRAFRVPSRRRLRRGVPGGTDRDTAIKLLQRNGGGTLSWMATWPENSYYLTTGGETCVAYQPHAKVAIALGDPIGPTAERGAAVSEYARMCDRSGLTPCMFSVGTAAADAAYSVGWRRLQVAEDTLVDLPDLAFKGKAWQNVRSSLNRAGKEGIGFRLVSLADEPWRLVAQIRAISEEWVGDKGLPEMGFTLGGVDEALDPHVRVGLAEDAEGTVHGVTSWLPVYAPDERIAGWTLDVMRRRHDGFKPVVEFMIASSCLAFQEEGARFVSLSGAPLARAGGDEPQEVMDRVLDRLGAAMEPYYGFRSLHTFKAKFNPRYEPMYLVYRDEGDLPRIGLALAKAYLPDADVRDFVRMAASGRS